MRPQAFLGMLLGQAAGIIAVGGGFWLLYLAFLRSNVLYGIAGGVLILGGMWVMAYARRAAYRIGGKEDGPGHAGR